MGNIVPQIWDDERFCHLSAVGQVVWFYLLTGPESCVVPGLLRISSGTVVDGVRKPEDEVMESLRHLSDIRMIETDFPRRLIRIPNVPRYNPPGNYNVLRGWFRRWQQVPACPTRDRHVFSLKAVVEKLIDQADSKSDSKKSAGWREAWRETFGTISVSVTTNQESLFRYESLNSSGNPSHNHFERIPSSTGSVDEIRNRNRDPKPLNRDPEAETVSEQFIPERASAAAILERLSERAGVQYSHKLSAHVEPVLALLREGYSEKELRMVIWHQANRWADDPTWREFLRPSTLFGNKFPEYLPLARRAWEESEGEGSKSRLRKESGLLAVVDRGDR